MYFNRTTIAAAAWYKVINESKFKFYIDKELRFGLFGLFVCLSKRKGISRFVCLLIQNRFFKKRSRPWIVAKFSRRIYGWSSSSSSSKIEAEIDAE